MNRDRLFKNIVLSFGIVPVLLTIGLGWELLVHSQEAISEFGLAFIWQNIWDPVRERFSALPFIYGTLTTSIISIVIAVPLGVGSAIFLAELAPRRVSNILTFFIELLAAIPSVILGLMGIFILVPIVRWFQPFLIDNLGFIPLFDGYPYGIGMFTAGLILAIMILPYITSISRDIILGIPQTCKEAALGLGATRWEKVKLVILPGARSGILGAIILALGRALGETMAVTMVIGNTPKISASLMDPAYSMASVIANEFAEAVSNLYISSLFYIALILFLITIIINGLARILISKTRKVA